MSIQFLLALLARGLLLASLRRNIEIIAAGLPAPALPTMPKFIRCLLQNDFVSDERIIYATAYALQMMGRSEERFMEPLHVALENGAMRALVPLVNKSQFVGLPEDVVEKLDIVFYGDPDRAVSKCLEM